MGFENGNDSTGTFQTQLMGGLDTQGKVRAIAVGTDGKMQTSGGGDATEITLQQVRDRLPTALVGGRLAVDVQSLSVTVNNAQLEIANDTGNPVPVSLSDGVSGVQASIKPASTAPVATDRAIVVAQRPDAIAATFGSLTLTNANTEYFFTFTSVKKYSFKVLAGGGSIRFTNVAGKVADPTLPYYTLDNTAEEVQDFGNCTFTGTLYFASSTAGTIILIQYWV